MTAAELLEQMPEFPDELEARTARGVSYRFSIHPLPVSQRPRLRIEYVDSGVVRYDLNEAAWETTLRWGEPYELVGHHRFQSQIEALEARAVRTGVNR